ncbi:MAG: hypothetical protein U1D06_07940 [Paracoccaceae bacterium]|nr:hypothetical protein [Paracoccaceae bacterium]
MQDGTEIAELERRITQALERIGKSLGQLAPVAATLTPAGANADQAHADQAKSEVGKSEVGKTEPAGSPPARPAIEIARLREALEVEKTANAQLQERLRAVKDRDAQTQTQLEARVEKMTGQLDVQGLELQRMRKITIQLREHLRILHEAAAEGLTEPHLINKAMLAELEALRATRHSEVAEMDEILAELAPLIEEVRPHA